MACTLVPWAGALGARWLGASRRDAPFAGLALLAAPEISVGLFALTPDLLLAPCWLLAAGAWGRALLRSDRGAPALSWALLAGLLAGLGASSKVSGFLLLLAMGLSLLDPGSPARRRSAPLAAGLALGALLASPVVAGELMYGFSMLQHRLVSTQRGAGLSPRNVGALVGGQLGYLSPLVLACGVALARWLRGQGGAGRWLGWMTVASGVPLAALCLWSRVAEPHWLAPAWLGVALAAALPGALEVPGARLRRWALGSGVALALLVHGWTLTELAPRFLGGAYEGRYDLANDLLLWARLGPALEAERARVRAERGVEPVVVAPHWIIAAQAAATGGVGLRAATVACLAGSMEPPDDFCAWEPPSGWGDAPLLWVSDDRFELKPPPVLPGIREERRVGLERGGRRVREAVVVRLR